MSKLIYSATSTVLENNLSGVYQTGSQIDASLPGYRVIAFTGDGYLYTHGQKFRIYKIVNNVASGLSLGWDSNGLLNLLDGQVSLSTIAVVGELEGDNIISVARGQNANYKKYTLTHAQPQTSPAGSYGGVTNASSVNVPSITVDAYGHITAASNVSLDATKVKASVIGNNDSNHYSIIGVNGATIQSPQYFANTYIDKDGAIYENNQALSAKYAAKQTANASNTGTVKLSDAIDGGAVTVNDVTTYLDVNNGTAATPYAVKLAIDEAKSYASGLFASNDALVFIGTINDRGVFTSHNNTLLPGVINNQTTISQIAYKAGYTAKLTNSGDLVIGTDTYAVTFPVEIGDVLVCVSDYNTTVKGSDFTVIQGNLDGTLTSADVLDGILIADNSRSVSSYAYPSSDDKILGGTSSGLSWLDYSDIWRTFYANDTNGTTISNKDIIIAAATGNGTTDPLTVSFDTSGTQATIKYTIHPKAIASSTTTSLILKKGSTEFEYDPTEDTDTTLTIGGGINLTETTENQVTTYILSHPTSAQEAISTAKLGKITTDSYGHITGLTEVTSLKNPNALYIATSNSQGTTVQTSATYDGSEVIGYNFKAGTDVTITAASKTNANGIEYTNGNYAKGIELTFGITHKYRPISIQKKSGSNYAEAISILSNDSSGTLTLKEGSNITLTNSSGTLTIDAANTWRPVSLYAVNEQHTVVTQGVVTDGSTLIFNQDLVADGGSLGICWTEVDDQGNITYIV